MHLFGCTFRIKTNMSRDTIKSKFHFSDVIIDLLIDRGLDSVEKISDFIGNKELSSPYLLPDVDRGVELINKYVSEKKSIVVFGDYDCDGVGAVVILYKALEHIGAKVNYFVPLRKKDGYGITWDALTRAYEEYKPSLIISVDCGISSYKEIERAKKELGIEFVITDHHSLPENLPDTIVINPHLNSGDELCGAGVAFKLACALAGEKYASELIEVCAISTIADLVPLTGENRTIVKKGLEKLNKRKTLPGLNALIDVSGIKGNAEIKVYDIAFKLAPRLNSAGRLSSAEASIKLLLAEDPIEIQYLARYLNDNNKERQDKCAEIFTEALEQLKDYDVAYRRVIVLENNDWDSGIIGIVASKLVEKFRCPVILLTEQNGVYVGSSRSVEGINMYEMLSSVKDLLNGYGGHSMAAGLQINPNNLEEFIERCTEYVRKHTYNPVEIKTYRLNADEVSSDIAEQLRMLEPFGTGNPEPEFEIFDLPPFQRIGVHNHIKCKLSSSAELIAFNMGDRLEFFNECIQSLIVKIERSVYKNVVKASCVYKRNGQYNESTSNRAIVRSVCENTSFFPIEIKDFNRREYRDGGKLIVTYDYNTYLEKKGDGLKGILCCQEDYQPADAIVLAPDERFVYDYYDEIVFEDYCPQGLYERLRKSFRGQIKLQKPDYAPPFKLSLEELQRVFLTLCAVNGRRFFTIGELHASIGEQFSYDSFCGAFFVLKELSLITLDEEQRIIISTIKNDRNNSYLWRSIGYER